MCGHQTNNREVPCSLQYLFESELIRRQRVVVQHSEDHSAVPTSRRAINTAFHRAQASLILATLGRSHLCHQSLRRNGCDHRDNKKPDHTANNDDGVDCRMHCFWMGHQIFQHSTPSICCAFGSTSNFPGQASSAALQVIFCPHMLDTLADWWGLQRHCGSVGDWGLFAPQLTYPGSSREQGSDLSCTPTGQLRKRQSEQLIVRVRTVGYHPDRPNTDPSFCSPRPSPFLPDSSAGGTRK